MVELVAHPDLAGPGWNASDGGLKGDLAVRGPRGAALPPRLEPSPPGGRAAPIAAFGPLPMQYVASLPGRIAALCLVLAASAAAQGASDPSVVTAPEDLLRDLGLSEATVQRLPLQAEPGATFSFPLWVEG